MQSSIVGGTYPPTARTARFSSSFLAGFLASQIAGLIMAAAMVGVYALFLKTPFYYPVQVIASYLFGDTALHEVSARVLVGGVLFHQLVCAAWGVVFGLCATVLRADKSISGPILLGIVIGLLSQIVDINLITPPLLRARAGHNIWAEEVPAWASWVGHVIFGLSLAIYIPMFRGFWLRFSHRSDVLRSDPRIT